MARQYNFVRVRRKIYAAEVLSQRDVLACDGQAMRATARLQPDGSRSSGKQITSIVSYETGMTLGQVIHDKKNQEKKAIIELAEDMDISNDILPGTPSTPIPASLSALCRGMPMYLLSSRATRSKPMRS